MNARDAILAAVQATRLSDAARPAGDLPDVRRAAASFAKPSGDVVQRFVVAARATEAEVVECARADLPAIVSERFATARRVISLVPEVQGDAARRGAPHELADTDLFVCEATFGVAENGAVWLGASRLGERAGLFLANEVLVIISRASIVEDLHAAYARVDLAGESFGIFVGGPSKTADIEQVLVLGAHGPKGLVVALVD